MVAFTTTLQADFTGTTAIGGAATWTDITRFMRGPATINAWRQDQLADVAPSTMTLVLDNADLPGDAPAPTAGRFTPGNASSPFAAGLKTLFRIRLGVTVNGTTYWRYDGYADPLDANWIDGEFGVCNVGATDWLGLAGTGMPLKSMLQETVLLSAPLVYLPLTDASGSATPAMLVAPNGVLARMRQSKYGGGTFAFAAAAGPVAEGQQVLTLTPTSSTQGFVAEAYGPLVTSSIVAFRVNWSGTATSCTLATLQGSNGQALTLSLTAAGLPRVVTNGFTGVSCTGPTAINDGKPHDIVCGAVGGISGGFVGSVTLWVDGVQVATASPGFGFLNLAGASWTSFQVGGWVSDAGVSGLATGTFSHAALWGSSGPSNASITAQYQAGATGFAGERIDLHIARLLSFRPNNGSALDVAQGNIGLHQIAGISLQQALLEAAKAETGLLYVDPNNAAKVTFLARWRLRNPTTAVTLDITAQQTTPDVNIREDTQQLFNDVTVTRPGGAAQRVVDTASQAGPLGVRATSVSLIVNSDQDALNTAGWLVANQKTPTPNVPQLVHDALTEPQATVATTQAVLAAGPLSRVTFANRPADFSVTDALVQGHTDTIGVDVFTVAFNTSRLPRPTLRFDAAADAFTKLDSGLVFSW